MTIILPPGTNVRLWRIRRKIRKWAHGLRRNPNCNERRRYRNDTQVIMGEHTHLPPLWQGGHKFDRVSVPVEFFRIASLPTVRKEDLMYLRINHVEPAQEGQMTWMQAIDYLRVVARAPSDMGVPDLVSYARDGATTDEERDMVKRAAKVVGMEWPDD